MPYSIASLLSFSLVGLLLALFSFDGESTRDDESINEMRISRPFAQSAAELEASQPTRHPLKGPSLEGNSGDAYAQECGVKWRFGEDRVPFNREEFARLSPEERAELESPPIIALAERFVRAASYREVRFEVLGSPNACGPLSLLGDAEFVLAAARQLAEKGEYGRAWTYALSVVRLGDDTLGRASLFRVAVTLVTAEEAGKFLVEVAPYVGKEAKAQASRLYAELMPNQETRFAMVVGEGLATERALAMGTIEKSAQEGWLAMNKLRKAAEAGQPLASVCSALVARNRTCNLMTEMAERYAKLKQHLCEASAGDLASANRCSLD